MTMERRHPVLGVLGGASMGLGIALVLFVYGIVPMTVLWLVLIVLALALAGWILARATPAGEPADDASVHPTSPTTGSEHPTAQES